LSKNRDVVTDTYPGTNCAANTLPEDGNLTRVRDRVHLTNEYQIIAKALLQRAKHVFACRKHAGGPTHYRRWPGIGYGTTRNYNS